MPSSDVRIPDSIAKTIVDPAAYAADDVIQESFSWLRQNNPLGQVEVEGFDPFWAVTKNADIKEVGARNDLFHNGDLQLVLTPKADDLRIREASGGKPYVARAIVQMDQPDHSKYRGLTNIWFSPRNIRNIEASIRDLARHAVDRMLEMDGECDFVPDVALHYPLRVIMKILGVPPEDEARMLRLTQEVFAPEDPEIYKDKPDVVDPAIIAARQQATFADFFDYFTRMVADRRANPRDDLASIIANSEIDGRPIEDFEAASYYIIIATAGHDTTSSCIAGTIWALCENPAEFAKVRENPALIPGLIDEGIRWVTPVKHFMRSATEKTELRGRTINEGDWLMLCYLSGNRDEEVFGDPFTFRVDRNPNKHVAFGYGAHVCLGQHLAKLEMRAFFEELAPRVATMEFNGVPKRSWATFVNGPRHLPIRYRAA